MKSILLLLVFFLSGHFSNAANSTLAQAEVLIRSGKTEDGKQILARYLTQNETASAYMDVGALYARMGKWDDSVHYFQIANKRDEKNAVILFKLALAQHQNKQTDEAIESLRKSIVLNDMVPRTYLAAGEMLELSHDRYDARNIYLAAIKKIGNRAEFRKKLCWLYFQDSFFTETLKQCGEAVKLDGRDVVSWTLLARSYYLNQQRPVAFNIFKKLLRRFPRSGLTYRARGLIYYEEKAYEQAINDLDPADDEAAIYLARSYFNLGYYDRALPLYVEANRIDRDYRFEFLSKQRELVRKDKDELANRYQAEVDKL
jgi:tetratricopeptide (TPR) repeat protein